MSAPKLGKSAQRAQFDRRCTRCMGRSFHFREQQLSSASPYENSPERKARGVHLLVSTHGNQTCASRSMGHGSLTAVTAEARLSRRLTPHEPAAQSCR
jgi:ribosomal protein L37E